MPSHERLPVRALVRILLVAVSLVAPGAAADANKPKPKPSRVPVTTGVNLQDCLDRLADHKTGWCNMTVDPSKVWRKSGYGPGERGVVGPRAAWDTWNGAAIAYPKMWFHGGGHNDSGMIDVYEYDIETGTIARIYTPPKFNVLKRKGKPGSYKYAWRHDASLPQSTHTYDGFLHDPTSGLLLLFTGYPYTHGYFKNDAIADDDPRIRPGGASGIFAFNPTDEEIKGVAPKSWKRLYTKPRGAKDTLQGGFPHSAYQDGVFYFGSKDYTYTATWKDDEFVVNETPAWKDRRSGPVTAEFFDGAFYRLTTRGVSRRVPGQGVRRLPFKKAQSPTKNFLGKQHGMTLAKFDANTLVYWNGKARVYTHDIVTGELKLCAGARTGTVGPKVHSKWFQHPQIKNIFIGWAFAKDGPKVYKLDPDACVSLPTYSTKSLQSYVNKSRNIVVPSGKRFAEGAELKRNSTIDLKGVHIARPYKEGALRVRSGSHTIKNLRVTRPMRAAIWAFPDVDLKVKDCHFENQHFGIITGNSKKRPWAGTLEIEGCTFLDGRGREFGKQHPTYAGKSRKVIARNVLVRRHHHGGHLWKSRARENLIEDSEFYGDESKHSRILDFPCGGKAVLRNVVGMSSPNSDNRDLISINVEGRNCYPNTEALKASEATLVFDNVKLTSNLPVAERGRKDNRVITYKGTLHLVCRGDNEFVNIPNPCPKPGEPGAVCEVVDGMQQCRKTLKGSAKLTHR